jgi:hypothetical protein
MIYDNKTSINELKNLLDKIHYHSQIFDLEEKEIYQELIMYICKYGEYQGYY